MSMIDVARTAVNNSAMETACDFCGERPAVWITPYGAACVSHPHFLASYNTDQYHDGTCGELIYKEDQLFAVCLEPWGTEHSHGDI